MSCFFNWLSSNDIRSGNNVSSTISKCFLRATLGGTNGFICVKLLVTCVEFKNAAVNKVQIIIMES